MLNIQQSLPSDEKPSKLHPSSSSTAKGKSYLVQHSREGLVTGCERTAQISHLTRCVSTKGFMQNISFSACWPWMLCRALLCTTHLLTRAVCWGLAGSEGATDSQERKDWKKLPWVSCWAHVCLKFCFRTRIFALTASPFCPRTSEECSRKDIPCTWSLHGYQIPVTSLD